MIGKLLFFSFAGVVVFARITPKVIRFLNGYEDKNTNEYERKRIQKWLDEDVKDIPTIPNSNGENYF
jgi:hypothetical protein